MPSPPPVINIAVRFVCLGLSPCQFCDSFSFFVFFHQLSLFWCSLRPRGFGQQPLLFGRITIGPRFIFIGQECVGTQSTQDDSSKRDQDCNDAEVLSCVIPPF